MSNSRARAAFVLGCLLLAGRPAEAQVIPVEAALGGNSFSSTATKTFQWPSKKPAATLIFIPGGNGHLGLADRQPQVGGFYEATLQPLSDPRWTSGRLNVVLFDSPAPLDNGSVYPTSRATSDHLMRIESVVLHYRDKLSLPIWLMGHSNGAASVTEFYKYLQKAGKESLVSGMIYSGARNGSDFNSVTTNLPVLFLHHENDGCAGALISQSRSVYDRLKSVDTAKVEYVAIKGGTSAPANPCTSGYHMYYGAAAEVYSAIDAFMSEYYR